MDKAIVFETIHVSSILTWFIKSTLPPLVEIDDKCITLSILDS